MASVSSPSMTPGQPFNSDQLNLSDRNLKAKGFIKALKTNPTLTQLDFRDRTLTDAGGRALAEILKINSCLTKLNLSNCKIGSTTATVAAFAEALKINSTLTQLDLSRNNHLGDTGDLALAEALTINSTLTELNLSNNYRFRGTSGTKLAEALKINSALTHLDLTCNFLEDPGATALAEALKTNSTLTQLNLRGCGLTDAGATKLAEALTTREFVHGSPVDTNPTPLKLDLSYNSITDQGAEEILKALNTNASLTDVNLGKNLKITPPVADQVTAACDSNTHNFKQRSLSLFELLLASPSWKEELLETSHSFAASSSQ